MKNVINYTHIANVMNTKRGFNKPIKLTTSIRLYQDTEPDAQFYWKKFYGEFNFMFHLTMAKSASKAICA